MSAIFDPTTPQPKQMDGWSCLASSITWAVQSLGSPLTRQWVRQAIRADHIVTPRGLLIDKSGHDIGHWSAGLLEGLGVSAQYLPSVDFDTAAAQAGLWPIILGGTPWLHYSAVRGYDPASDSLLLANASEGWMRVGAVLTRKRFEQLRPVSMVRIAPSQVLEEGRSDSGTPRLGGLRPAVVGGGGSILLPTTRDLESLELLGTAARLRGPYGSGRGVLHELRTG